MGLTYQLPVSTNTLRRVTLTGAPSNLSTPGTDYFYNITTSSESSTCTTDTFSGSAITVRNNPTITLISGNISETVCDGSAINPIILELMMPQISFFQFQVYLQVLMDSLLEDF